MNVSENLKVAVREKNIADIRGALWSCLMVDTNMTGRFKQSLDYVLSNGISESELYEDDDGTSFSEESTEANFDTLAGLIRVNFSKRKLEALRHIGRKLSPPMRPISRPQGVAGGGSKPAVREVPSSRGRDCAGRKLGCFKAGIAIIAATIIIALGGYIIIKILK